MKSKYIVRQELIVTSQAQVRYHCILIANLKDTSLLPTLFSDILTKGVMYELNKYRSSNSHSWNDLYSYLAYHHQPCQVLKQHSID